MYIMLRKYHKVIIQLYVMIRRLFRLMEVRLKSLLCHTLVGKQYKSVNTYCIVASSPFG